SSTQNPDALPQLVGDFQPVDQWQTHINKIFYGLRGHRVRDFYQTFAAADYRLAYALAEDYIEQRRKRDKAGQNPNTAPPLVVMEWGAGNGNLAACFLDRLKELDREVTVFPRIKYICVERESALLDQAKSNPDLTKHGDHVTFESRSLEDLTDYADGSVDRIICNELWSELPTKLVLRKEGDIQEEHLRPNLSERRLADFPDWAQFVEAFAHKDIQILKSLPPFLEDFVWEREYHPVDAKALPFRRTVWEFLKTIDEEVLVPFNVGACQSLKEIRRLLAPDAVGLSSFDAGTSDHRVLNDPEKPCYTVQGGQFSFMVNFPLIQQVAAHLGTGSMIVEPQREFVGRSLGTIVMSLMDVLASHPYPPQGQPWEMDALILKTIHAFNKTYQSPYQRTIEFPIHEQTPSREREELEALMASFSGRGVPDTIAYLTEDEIWKAMPDLEALGYEAEGIKHMLQAPHQSVDYMHCLFRPERL
ncbi:MAG: SAM-dependent methyltransferase, partial [Nitrospirales bacterium]|nr:SAM-dependent methyltransferase [Nitrospirales bacterium]